MTSALIIARRHYQNLGGSVEDEAEERLKLATEEHNRLAIMSLEHCTSQKVHYSEYNFLKDCDRFEEPGGSRKREKRENRKGIGSGQDSTISSKRSYVTLQITNDY